MEPKIKLKFIFVILFLLSSALHAEVVQFDTSDTSVEFLAIGNPSAIKIKGEKAKVQGEVNLVSNALNANLKVDLNDFTTGIEMRDEHLKEKYLETEKPENRYSTIEILNLNLPLDYFKSEKEFNTNFNGKINLHGVSKDISGKISLSPFRKGEKVMTTSQFSIKLTNFNIEVPSFVGITVAEDVNVEVKLPLKFSGN